MEKIENESFRPCADRSKQHNNISKSRQYSVKVWTWPTGSSQLFSSSYQLNQLLGTTTKCLLCIDAEYLSYRQTNASVQTLLNAGSAHQIVLITSVSVSRGAAHVNSMEINLMSLFVPLTMRIQNVCLLPYS